MQGAQHQRYQVHNLLQVVVVVTNNWDVLCFDHNLRLRWSHKIKARTRPTTC